MLFANIEVSFKQSFPVVPLNCDHSTKVSLKSNHLLTSSNICLDLRGSQTSFLVKLSLKQPFKHFFDVTCHENLFVQIQSDVFFLKLDSMNEIFNSIDE